MVKEVITKQLLERQSLRLLAKSDVLQLADDCTLAEAILFFEHSKVFEVPVVDSNKKLIGVVGSRELLKAVFAKYSEQTSLKELARKPHLIIHEGEPLNPVLALMIEQGILEALVVDQDDILIGTIILNDVVNAIWKSIVDLNIFYNNVLETVHNGVIVVNAEGTIIFFNAAAGQIFGRHSDEVLGRPINVLVSNSKLLDVIQTQEPELAYRRNIGDNTIMANYIPVVLNGKVLGAVAVFEDITELESITEKLNSSEKLKATLEAIVQNSYEGLVVIDDHERVVMMNQFYLNIAGLTEEEVVGKHIWEVSPHSQLPTTVRTGAAQLAEPWHVGGQDYMIMRIPIKKNGKIIGAIGKVLFNMDVAKVFAQKVMQLQNDLEYYKEELRKLHSSEHTFNHIIGESEKITSAMNLAQRAARTSSTVLLTGESGTGKEVFAQAIHSTGLRSGDPFIKVNCAAVPEQLLESELFGYAEGAFTGARKGGKPGKFEMADQGTIFLDEIGDMSLSMQAKLLRVIQEREFERVGGTQPIKVDVRLIAATNRDLLRMVKENTFRLDLYYRLNVITIELPSLKERLEDIKPLTKYLIAKLNQKLGTYVEGVSNEAMELLKQYPWPGNIRELENVLERAMNISDERFIYPEHLPVQLRQTLRGNNSTYGQKTLEQGIFEAERNIILNALRQAKGNKVHAAQALGIHRSVLYKKLARHNL